MNTKNIKTAVIILLVTANIFFIYNIIKLRLSSENIPPEMLENAVNILARSGLIAERGDIPAKNPSKVIYEGIYSPTLSKDIIENFSGENFFESVEIYVPAGISYAAGDYRFIFFDEDHFKVDIAEKDYIEAGETEIAGVWISGGDIKKAKNIIGEFLKKSQNRDTRLGFEITEFEENKVSGRQRLWLVQTVDKTPVDSHIVYAEIQNGRVKYFSGRWYFGELSMIAKRMPLLNSVNILFKSVETDGNLINGKQLIKMDTEYTVVPHSEGNFWLVPSWRLKFEDDIILSYNMITGNKMIKEDQN